MILPEPQDLVRVPPHAVGVVGQSEMAAGSEIGRSGAANVIQRVGGT
jgi:hypothetical protein